MYANVFRNQPPPKWDEAHHLLFAWQIWADLTEGSIIKFLRDSYAQILWSFLHSWWVAGFMTVFGVTDFGARIASFAAMIISVLLVFNIGKRLYKEPVPWSGLLAVALFLMLGSLPGLAAECMMEMPAVMMSFFALLLFIRAEQKRTRAGYAQFGCALAAAFLMKYNFGLVLIAAFVVVAVSEISFNRAESYWHSAIVVLVPLVLVFVFWLIVPKFRLYQYLETLVNRPHGPQELGWAYFGFYPKVIYADFGWWVVLLAGAIIQALWYLKDRVMRLLFCVGVLSFGIIIFHQTKDTRYIYTVYLGLIPLASFAVVSWTSALLKGFPRLRAGLLMFVMVAMFLRPVAVLAKPRMPTEREVISRAVAAYVVDQLKNGQAVFIIGEFNSVSAHLISWELHKRGDRMAVHQSMDHKPALEGVTAFTPGSGGPAALPKLAALLEKLSVDTVLTIGLEKTSPFYDGDYRTWNEWKQKYVDLLSGVPGYTKMAAQEFASVGLAVTVYRRVNRGQGETL